MSLRYAVIAAVVAYGLATSPASATLISLLESVPVAFSKNKGKWKHGGCTYKYKADRKGYKEEYKCK